MLTSSKKTKMLTALKSYKKKFLDLNLSELDESGTRLMINHFLSDVLGYLHIEEIKTEYMIKGTYADYVIQTKGIRHFLVEVKALSFQLSDKHLRQTINYGANEGIEWALLTNGKNFDFYKILFNKPIESKKIFSVDLSETANIKVAIEQLQYLHKESILKKGLKLLWNKCEAVRPENVAGILYSKEVINTVKKLIKNKYGEKFGDEEILKSLQTIVCEKFDPQSIKPFRSGKTEKKSKKNTSPKQPQLPEIEMSEKILSHSEN
jgi:hypothetical protein